MKSKKCLASHPIFTNIICPHLHYKVLNSLLFQSVFFLLYLQLAVRTHSKFENVNPNITRIINFRNDDSHIGDENSVLESEDLHAESVESDELK